MPADIHAGLPDRGRDRRNLDAAHWEGYIDAIEGGRVYGWALDMSDKSRRLSIVIQHGSDELATVVADRFREDLVGYGDGSGHHAFVYTLPRNLWDVSPGEFHARFAGTDVPLLRGRRATAVIEHDESGTPHAPSPTREADPLRLAGRVETLERSIIGLMRLIDPRSESSALAQGHLQADIARLQSEIAGLHRDIRAIEPFLTRLDERLKQHEAALPRRGEGRGIPMGQVSLVFVLIAAAAVLGYAVATYLA